MQVCPGCGEENPPRFRLCGFCGATLPSALTAHEERKTVTIVFSDLKGSTSMGELLDTETLRAVMTRYFETMTVVLRRHGGTIEKFIGDAIMAVFGLPRVHEDDALRAVRAAAEMKVALAELNEELERAWGVQLVNRTGVNTGEVIAGDPAAGQRLVIGDPVNVAARLEQAAPALEVLIGESTYRLVRDAVEIEELEPLELKGKAEPVPAYRLISVRGEEGVARRRDVSFVGREAELRALTDSYAEATAERSCRTVTIIGDAGVGKSRLAAELIRHVEQNATVLRGRCLSYGEGITFWPLIEVTREAAGIGADDSPEVALAKLGAISDADVAERLGAAIGLGSEQFVLTETFWAVRRLLERVAADHPLVLIVDDIHWAEPTLLELIEHLVETVEAPVLVLCTARHELLEKRDDWATDNRSVRLTLEPLAGAETSQLISQLLGDAELSHEVTRRVIEAAEGNPLFVEQLVAMLIDSGDVMSVEGRWRLRPARGTGTIVVPPTIQALLAARLDQLSREERAVVEPASVVGLEFERPAVEALVPDVVRPDAARHLGVLTRKQLIRIYHAAAAEAETYRFQHGLVRDAAYSGLLKRARATLHERFATWAEETNRTHGGAIESEEILGYHLEQAHRYLTELAPADDKCRALAQRAAERLSSAGRRAFQRDDMPAAANLLQRAAALLPIGDANRLALLADLGEALIDTGQFEAAAAVLTAGIDEATAAGDGQVAAHLSLVELILHLYTGNDAGWSRRVTETAERSIALFGRIGDDGGLARAWRLMYGVHGTAGRYGDATNAADRIIEHARAADDRRQENRGMSNYVISALYGPDPIPDVIARCEELMERVDDDRRTAALIRSTLGHLLARRGEFDAGRRLCREARSLLDELGQTALAAGTCIDSSQVEVLAGDLIAAELDLRRDYAALSELGEEVVLSTVAGLLGRVLSLQQRYAEAEEMSHRAEQLSGEDDVESQTLWRSVRAVALASRGELQDALALAREATRLAMQAVAPLSQADSLIDLATVCDLADLADESRAAREQARALASAKGDLVIADYVERCLSEAALTRK